METMESTRGGPPNAPGAMPKLKSSPDSAMGRQQTPEMPVGKIFFWARRVVATAKGRFAASLGASVLAQQLQAYEALLLGTAVGLLSAKGASGLGAAAGGAGGFLGFLVPDTLQSVAIVFVIVSLASIAMQFFDNTLSQWSDNAMVARLQEQLHDRIIRLGPKFHERVGIAKTQQILTTYLRAAQTMFRQIIAYPVLYGVSFATAIIGVLNGFYILGKSQTGILPWVLLAAILAMPFFSWKLSTRLRAAFRQVTNEDQHLAVEFANSASRPLEIQLLGAGPQRSASFRRAIDNVLRARFRAIVRNEIASQVRAATPKLLRAAVLIYGVIVAARMQSEAAQHAAGALVQLMNFVPLAVAPILTLLDFANTVNNARPQLELVIDALEAEPEVEDAPRPLPAPAGAKDLAVESVRVALKASGTPVLDGVDHAFAPARTTAIVGRSGSGKSTLLTVIRRLRNIDGGRIALAGIDVKSVALGELPRSIAMLSQFPLLIDASVRDNLLLGRADASDAEMEAVCRDVGLWPVLESAAEGSSPLDATLSMEANKGVLSGGQRKLLAFARLLLSRAPVVLLDEPTTGVDSLTQSTLVDLVRTRLTGRTVLLVDHDMDFVAAVADRVCCLEAGKITDVVEKAELFQRQSLFRSLYEARSRAIGGGLAMSTPPSTGISLVDPGLIGTKRGGPGGADAEAGSMKTGPAI
jgi:ATP-binding cassette, subfamily B, bacterial